MMSTTPLRSLRARRCGQQALSLSCSRGASWCMPASTVQAPAAARFKTCRKRAVKVQAVFEKFSERSIKTVMIAQQEAKALGAPEVTNEHVLLGLISEDIASKNGYLESGLTIERAKAAVEKIHGRRKPLGSEENISFNREVRKTFEAATNEGRRAQLSFINPEHILLAMLGQTDGSGRRVLDILGMDADVLRAEAIKRLKGDQEGEAPKRKRDKEGPKALDEYCHDLCAAVKQGKIDPVIGREAEVGRVIQILGRRTKNNPILLGEPGVGKTALAEGLAHAIVHNVTLDGSPLPAFLRTKRVLQLDVALMIAGAKERGELENRVTRLLAECRDAGNVVLMIDEVHTLVGAGAVGRGGGGGGGGGLDVSNLIKPALARGELQCIGATTVEEHRKHIERDAALERRFQPVYVNEPDEDQSLAILRGLAPRYERHHRCVYSEEALAAAVELSVRYIADRYLPDKAIDVIDEAGSRARIASFAARKAGRGGGGDHKVAEYLQVVETKEEAVKDGLYEEAYILRKREMDYKTELVGPAEEGSRLPVVDVADIEAVVAAWTRIPVERMSEDERARLARLGPLLKESIIGQDAAVEAVTAALARARCGLKDPSRPMAALLFVGPTGVGKTELTRVLATQYFGSGEAVVRLDCSEYMERHSVSKLIGAPPGYVGYGEGGKLTEAVRRRPCCIVLFDEIEKAHPDVFSILLQIMEDGRLTDSQGRTVSFKNTLVILTSNIGSRVIAATDPAGRAGAFGADAAAAAEAAAEAELETAIAAHSQSRLSRMVLEEVRGHFRPELLNRLDEQVVFHRLGRPEVATIAGLMMEETAARAASRGFELEVAPEALAAITAEGYSLEYGVRPLRQVIVHWVDDVLSDAILQKRIQPGDTAYVGWDADARRTYVIDKRELRAPVTVHVGAATPARAIEGGAAAAPAPAPAWVLATGGGAPPPGAAGDASSN